MRITPYYLRLIREPGDPIWRQCVPDLQELDRQPACDPLDEERSEPGAGTDPPLSRPGGLARFLHCAVYCRFCMRKRRVGCPAVRRGRPDRRRCWPTSPAIPAIRDVILSGGDPLLLNDDTWKRFFRAAPDIPHVEMIRIGTRVPVTLPARITARLCRMLKRYHPLYLNTHFNHPREITPRIGKGLCPAGGRRHPAGQPDGAPARGERRSCCHERLMQQLLAIRVRPYYLHQMDLVKGTAISGLPSPGVSRSWRRCAAIPRGWPHPITWSICREGRGRCRFCRSPCAGRRGGWFFAPIAVRRPTTSTYEKDGIIVTGNWFPLQWPPTAC